MVISGKLYIIARQIYIWVAAFQVNLSLLFFLISTYAGIKATAIDIKNSFQWKVLSLFSLILSALSYEVALPLVFLNILLFWNPIHNLHVKRWYKNHIVASQSVFIAVNIIVFIYLMMYKATTTTRLDKLNYPNDIIRLMISVVHVNFYTLGLNVPFIIRDIFVKYASLESFILGGILFCIIFIYTYLVLSETEMPKVLFMQNLIFFGLVIFFMGYSIFLINNRIGFSPTGIDNRVSIAASIGLAFIIVGIFGWISQLIIMRKLSKIFFCVFIAIVCTTGFLIVNTLASFWVTAYQEENAVLSDIYIHLPQIPKNSTLILDGVCPYSGPAIIFESQWDLMGALQTIYKDPTMRADIVTPRLKVANNGINTQIYTFKSHYPYKNVFIYNFRNKQVHYISNASDAHKYFQTFNPDRNNGCPNSSAGNGVSIF